MVSEPFFALPQLYLLLKLPSRTFWFAMLQKCRFFRPKCSPRLVKTVVLRIYTWRYEPQSLTNLPLPPNLAKELAKEIIQRSTQKPRRRPLDSGVTIFFLYRTISARDPAYVSSRVNYSLL